MPINRSAHLAALALCAAAALPATASAKTASKARSGPLPKLLNVSPLGAAMPGAHVPVRATLTGRSARTRLTYLLSADRRPSTSDRKLGSAAVPALRGGKTRIVTHTLTIPARGRIGSWYLLACVGAGAHLQCSAVPLPVLAKPSPRSVTASADAAHAASQPITADGGGTVTATGADGSTYTLTLPAGALASDETITLTPVAALSGLRAGTPTAGVQIAPDGLALLKPATLTITPAHPVPVADQIGYFWHGSGQESGLYPPNADPKSFTLTLNHFSGYELVDGNRVARKQLASQPTDVQERYADLAQAVADLRATGTEAAREIFFSTLSDYLRTTFDGVVKPALTAAETDDTLAFDALQRGLMWLHDVQGLGEFSAETAYVLQKMAAITDNALAQSAKRCSQNVAFTQRVLYYARLRAGASLSSDDNNVAALQQAQKCMQFQLDFTSTTLENAGWQFVADVQVKDLHVPAIGISALNQLQKNDPPPPPSTSVQYTRLGETTGAEGCSWSFGGPQESQPFTVYRLSIDATLREVVGHDGHSTFQTPPPAIAMEMTPGAYTEPFTVQCPHDQAFSGAQKVFTGGWIVTHQSEVTPQGHWILLNWTPGTNGVLAQKTYDQTLTGDGGTSISQQSTLTISYATGQ
jgi:hypothetical protein